MILYDHQKAAIEKLHNGAILCAGVGVGKSLTALGYFVQKVLPNNPDMALYVITTARKRDTLEWEDEFLKMKIGTEYKVSTVVDSWNNITKYLTVENAFFIFDEQRAVGKGQWSRSFVKIARKNQWIMLTATPGDTWMDYIPVFLANNFYKNRSEFIRRHVVFAPYVRYPVVQKYLEVEELIELRESILVSMFYKKPAIIHEETIIIPYDELRYKGLIKNRWNYETDEPISNSSELCSLLRKISGENEERIDKVMEVVNEHKKVVIFYNYNYELDRLIERLTKEKYPHSQWNGHKHELIPDSEEWAYLVQYAAGAEGWNCTDTDTLIFYSPNYSYKIMEQAKGRIDRMNTPFTDLYYYYYRTDSDIDKSIMRCLSRKKKFNEKNYVEELL